MNDIHKKLPNNIYNKYLKKINGISFTSREIDIISFLTSGRSAKKIASFLEIAPKTVEYHTTKIMRKLGCNSRENIIDFIEKSNQFSFVKKYYLSLLIQASFEQKLKKISTLIGKELGPVCSIVYWQESEEHSPIIRQIEKNLKYVGIKVSVKARKGNKSLIDSINSLDPQQKHYTLFLVSSKHIENFSLQKIKVKLGCSIILLLDQDAPSKLYNNIDCKKLLYMKDYYISVFLILKKLLPHIHLESIILEFKQQVEGAYRSDESTVLRTETTLLKKNRYIKTFNRILYKYINIIYFTGMACLSMLVILFLLFNNNKKDREFYHQENTKEVSIRSDLVIPPEPTLLNRSALITKIQENLKGNRKIQTIALVGIGGAGKTTIARQYARTQKSSVIWEINAETNDSLIASFENLAYALSETEEERKILRGLQEIKVPQEKEEKILFFVKQKLKIQPNWFLIYDNVEEFSALQRYFPLDPETWGSGKVIITARDNNIKNSMYVNHSIQIEELASREKLNLFINIMYGANVPKLSSMQKEQINTFLNHLPSFPLDVSIAAYYIKTTNISYSSYLENMKKNDIEFETIQKNIIKEASNYTKTRYNLIISSLKQLMEVHKDFPELLLFISLIDSQNIPKNLLYYFKNDLIVDKFVYHLKKYSLITAESSIPSYGPALSIHRSTQAITLAFLIKTLNIEKNKQLIKPITIALERCLDNILETEDVVKMKLIESHFKALLKYYLLLNHSEKNIVYGSLGRIYAYLGDYLKAEKFLKKSFSSLNAEKEDINRAACNLGWLGDTYSEIGRHKEARDLLKKSITLYKKYFSENHNNIIRTSSNLGYVYKELGDYKKATALLEQNLIAYRTYFPNDHLGVVWALLFLGYLYQDLGNYQKAKDSLQNSLAICEQYHVENHILTAWTLTHLGNIQLQLGNTEKAKNLTERALTICKIHFSDNHTGLAVILGHLGEVNRELRNYKEAKDLFEKSLTIFKTHYVEDHIRIALALRDLSKIYFLEGHFDLADTFLNKAEEVFQKNKHPRVYIILEDRAELFFKKFQIAQHSGDLEQAKNFKAQAVGCLKKALEIVKKKFPADSIHIQRIQGKIKKFSLTQ